jgi:phosphatidylglycerol:prolipoprotein diacylglycerol transferase
VPFVIPYPDIDPAIFTLSLGDWQFSLRWYALAYIVGLVLGWRIVVRLMRAPILWPANRAPMTPQQPEELLTWMTLGVVIGGRLGFVLFYNPGYYLANPAEILAVWSGGMSFHGGMIGVIVALVGYCLKNGIPVLQAADAVAVATPVGLFFGRLANFVNAELWGRPTDVPWAMRFPQVNPATGQRDMTLLTEPRHPSQLYEAGLEGIVLFAVLLWLALSRRWLKWPGAITGAFLAGYGAARVFVENFRQGDAQFITAANPNGHVIRFGETPDAFGLTMGQILSLPMVAAGLLFILLAARRTAPA